MESLLCLTVRCKISDKAVKILFHTLCFCRVRKHLLSQYQQQSWAENSQLRAEMNLTFFFLCFFFLFLVIPRKIQVIKNWLVIQILNNICVCIYFKAWIYWWGFGWPPPLVWGAEPEYLCDKGKGVALNPTKFKSCDTRQRFQVKNKISVQRYLQRMQTQVTSLLLHP